VETAAGKETSMPAVVARRDGEGWHLEGSWADPDIEVANRFLAHLTTRAFSPATVRAYAYDLLNFACFCMERGVTIVDAVAGNDSLICPQERPK
jgi:hypothetical protein